MKPLPAHTIGWATVLSLPSLAHCRHTVASNARTHTLRFNLYARRGISNFSIQCVWGPANPTQILDVLRAVCAPAPKRVIAHNSDIIRQPATEPSASVTISSSPHRTRVGARVCSDVYQNAKRVLIFAPGACAINRRSTPLRRTMVVVAVGRTRLKELSVFARVSKF